MSQKAMLVCLVASLCAQQGLRAQAREDLYVADTAGNRIFAYTVEPATGFLTPVAGSPFPTGRSPISIAVDPSGQFAYVAESVGTVSGYIIDRASGGLRPIFGSPFAAGPLPSSIVADPMGKFLYVANEGNCGDESCTDSSISAYVMDSSNGTLAPTEGSPFPTEEIVSATVEPGGHFVYAAGWHSDAVFGFEIDSETGNLTPLDGSPFPTGAGPAAIAVDPKGQVAYVANFWSGSITAYRIDATTGALTPIDGSPFPAETYIHALAIEPSGQFLYATTLGTNHLRGYAIDSDTGKLTDLHGSPFTTDSIPQTLAADTTGQFLYVTTGGGWLWAYQIQPTGSLTPTPDSPFSAGTAAWAVVTVIQPQIAGTQ
jgi:6-phosphogluconolactonase (cycloisomerase 2 family)